MGLDLDPAALAGLAGFIAVAGWAAGWAAGRMQAGRLRSAPQPDAPKVLTEAAHAPAPGPAPQHPPSGAACQQRALEERRELLSRPVSLADLHAEVSAIRRDERILQRGMQADALLMTARADFAANCRFLGLSGRPTCPASSCDGCQGPTLRQTLAAAPVIMPMPGRC